MQDRSRVVITGAARGIGKAIALSWARRGAHVVLVARSTDANPSRALPGTLEQAADEVSAAGGEATIVGADLSSDDGVAAVVSTISAIGGCDVLVNNAAVSFLGGFLDVAARRWAVATQVNLLAPVALTQAVLPGMLERKQGVVLNLSSGAATEDPVPQLPYGCSKAALERLTFGLHRQYEGQGVAFQCIRIDELIPTEAVEYSLKGEVLDVPVCQVDDFAEATILLSEHAELSGEVLTHGRLRELGLLK